MAGARERPHDDSFGLGRLLGLPNHNILTEDKAPFVVGMKHNHTTSPSRVGDGDERLLVALWAILSDDWDRGIERFPTMIRDDGVCPHDGEFAVCGRRENHSVFHLFDRRGILSSARTPGLPA